MPLLMVLLAAILHCCVLVLRGTFWLEVIDVRCAAS
jgi:hypothetical protein